MIPRPRDGREPASGEPEEPEGLLDGGSEPGLHPDPAPAEDAVPDMDDEPGRHRDTVPVATDPGGGGDDRASADMMRLLGEHVPLTLLADLAERDGPASPVILEKEGLPEVAWWEQGSN